MVAEIHQGDILKIEGIRHSVLVVSKDFFNASGEIIGCPIYECSTNSPLHIQVSAKETTGYVQCEKLALLDLSVRGYKKTDVLALEDRINIADAVQAIFDYM